MNSGRIQFAWDKRRPPEPLTFGFYFRPILPLLGACYWYADHWPLGYPAPEGAEDALAQVVGDVAPPGVILPRFAFDIYGDRDEFYGFTSPPPPLSQFTAGLYAARQRDTDDSAPFFNGVTHRPKLYEQASRRYESHVAKHGCHSDRHLDDSGIEFAFMTNDSVWWIAHRDATVGDRLESYAQSIPGMSFRKSISFGL